MSWRTGSKLFIEMWPLIQANIKDRQERIDFTAELLKLFVKEDMDAWDVEDVHPDIRAAMLHAGIEISEPERYSDVPQKKRRKQKPPYPYEITDEDMKEIAGLPPEEIMARFMKKANVPE